MSSDQLDCAIVMLGPPGSGKGTQVSHFVEFGFYSVSVGDILRGSGDRLVPSLNKTVADLISSGLLLPDDFICDLVRCDLLTQFERDKGRMVIFDGFPRTVGQAKYLGTMLADLSIPIKYAFNFCLSEDIIFKRITGRFSCKTCGRIYNEFLCDTKVKNLCDVCGSSEFVFRTDDNEESLKTRLSQYYEKSAPLVDFYDKAGLLCNMDASLRSDDIKRELFSKIGIG